MKKGFILLAVMVAVIVVMALSIKDIQASDVTRNVAGVTLGYKDSGDGSHAKTFSPAKAPYMSYLEVITPQVTTDKAYVLIDLSTIGTIFPGTASSQIILRGISLTPLVVTGEATLTFGVVTETDATNGSLAKLWTVNLDEDTVMGATPTYVDHHMNIPGGGLTLSLDGETPEYFIADTLDSKSVLQNDDPTVRPGGTTTISAGDLVLLFDEVPSANDAFGVNVYYDLVVP